jgi:hypothetical protein
MHKVRGPFGSLSGEAKLHPCMFGVNDKSGMNPEEFRKYIKNICHLYPDSADVDQRRVCIKVNSGT